MNIFFFKLGFKFSVFNVMNLCSFRFDVNVKALFQVSSGHKNLSNKDPDKLISDLFFSCFCCSHSRFNLEKRRVSSAC